MNLLILTIPMFFSVILLVGGIQDYIACGDRPIGEVTGKAALLTLKLLIGSWMLVMTIAGIIEVMIP